MSRITLIKKKLIPKIGWRQSFVKSDDDDNDDDDDEEDVCGMVIVFVVWLTDERCLPLFPAGTIIRDPHHHESPIHS